MWQTKLGKRFGNWCIKMADYFERKAAEGEHFEGLQAEFPYIERVTFWYYYFGIIVGTIMTLVLRAIIVWMLS